MKKKLLLSTLLCAVYCISVSAADHLRGRNLDEPRGLLRFIRPLVISAVALGSYGVAHDHLWSGSQGMYDSITGNTCTGFKDIPLCDGSIVFQKEQHGCNSGRPLSLTEDSKDLMIGAAASVVCLTAVAAGVGEFEDDN